MICPYCNIELIYHHINDGDITKQLYICDKCGKKFERHFVKNKIGLIKMDCLHEINEEKVIIKSWL